MQRAAPSSYRSAGFTIVDVMMASVILLIGFIGLIEAVTLSTNAMEHARRQSLAAQILAHYTEELYLARWATISAISTSASTLTIDSQFDAARQALGDDLTTASIVRFTLTRQAANPDPLTNVREIKFTVTWVVKTSRTTAGGTRLSFTYTRSSSTWYGKYGLMESYGRS